MLEKGEEIDQDSKTANVTPIFCHACLDIFQKAAKLFIVVYVGEWLGQSLQQH